MPSVDAAIMHTIAAGTATMTSGAPTAAITGYARRLVPATNSTTRPGRPSGTTVRIRPQAGFSSSRSDLKQRASAAYATIQPTIATGTMRSAYSLRPMPARSATTRFIGLPVGSGATPAATNTANENGTTSFGWRLGYSERISSITTGVNIRIAASFDSTAAVIADSANTVRKPMRTGPRVRGSIHDAR